MTAEELYKHPEFDHTVWDLKPAKQGKFAVAKDRGGPINIAYEIHGHGDRHLVVSGPALYIWPSVSCDTTSPNQAYGAPAFVIHISSEFLCAFCPNCWDPSTFCFSRTDRLTTPFSSHVTASQSLAMLFCPEIYARMSLLAHGVTRQSSCH